MDLGSTHLVRHPILRTIFPNHQACHRYLNQHSKGLQRQHQVDFELLDMIQPLAHNMMLQVVHLPLHYQINLWRNQMASCRNQLDSHHQINRLLSDIQGN